MARQIALFEAPLTTRGVADIVRSEGVAGLPSATRLADDAHYQEVVCRSALNRTRGMPFRWTLNPYRGCTHACQYCFARRYQTQMELGAGDQFSSYIFVKRNVADRLARELARPIVDAGTRGRGDGDRPLSAHRRPVPPDARMPGAPRRGEHADWPRHQGADGRARCGHPRKDVAAWTRDRLRQRADGGCRVGTPRTRNGAADAAPAGGATPAGRRGSRRSPHESVGPGLHDAPLAESRRRLRRWRRWACRCSAATSSICRTAAATTSCSFSRRGATPAREVLAPVRGQICGPVVHRPGEGHPRGAARPIREPPHAR